MKLADNQIELLQAVREANPNTVVIVNAGASLETPWLAHCKALVYGALGGQAGAGAMVDVLTGKINPRQAGRDLGQRLRRHPRPRPLCRPWPHRTVPRGTVRRLSLLPDRRGAGGVPLRSWVELYAVCVQ